MTPKSQTPSSVISHPLASAFILVAAVLLFSVIAWAVVNDEPLLRAADLHAAAWFHARATPWLTATMVFISYFGAPVTVNAVALGIAVVLLQRHRLYQSLAVILAVPGGTLLNVLVKHAVQRDRPAFDDPLLTLATYSFPSGHALGSTALYGVLVALVSWSARTGHSRTLASVCAVAIIGLVCVSRIYLGLHYLSDVLAGILEGVAWLVLCLSAVKTLRIHRESHGNA